MDFNRQWQGNRYSPGNTFPPRRDRPQFLDNETYSRNRNIRRDRGSRGFGNRGNRGFSERENRGLVNREIGGVGERGIRDFGYRGFQNRYSEDRRHYPYPQRNMRNREAIPNISNDVDPSVYRSPLELKIEKLVSAVQSQGTLGQIILLQSNAGNTREVLGNACQSIPCCKLEVKENHIR